MKIATLGAIALAFTATSNSFTVPTSTNIKSPSASSAMSRLALQPTNNLLRPSSTALHLGVSGIMTRPVALAVGGTISALVAGKAILDRPSRPYNPDSVATEYDAWTEDGILEYYWGEHIHLGYYSEKEMERGYKKTNFIEAKYKFIDEMMSFGSIPSEQVGGLSVLDVGCGVGGTSRYIARAIGKESKVTGITLSPNQVKRAQELAVEQETPNAHFQVMDALKMDFPDNSFDVVWACESGEHMPDKEKYISEMMRVLKPGGKFVMATWCQRDDREVPFSKKDNKDLKFLYEEWTHPYFISIEKYAELIEGTGMMESVGTADWVRETIASWRHSIWVGVYDPRGFIFKPRQYLKCVRDGYCLERMHRAFDRGLMQYGMFHATKKLE